MDKLKDVYSTLHMQKFIILIRKQKINALRGETETAHEKIDELSSKVKSLDLSNTSKDQEITSLTHRNELLEKKLEEYEEKLDKFKGLENDESGARGERESLLRKVALLEEEAEQNDKNLKETTEK